MKMMMNFQSQNHSLIDRTARRICQFTTTQRLLPFCTILLFLLHLTSGANVETSQTSQTDVHDVEIKDKDIVLTNQAHNDETNTKMKTIEPIATIVEDTEVKSHALQKRNPSYQYYSNTQPLSNSGSRRQNCYYYFHNSRAMQDNYWSGINRQYLPVPIPVPMPNFNLVPPQMNYWNRRVPAPAPAPVPNFIGGRFEGNNDEKNRPVPANRWNQFNRKTTTTTTTTPAPTPMFVGVRFNNDDEEEERVIWDRYPLAAAPVNNLGSIFHESDPAKADTSFLNSRRRTSTPSTTTTTVRPALSIFHDSDPANADLSFLTARQRPATTPIPIPNQLTIQQASPLADRRPTTTEPSPAVTACVWAIVNCCSSRDQNVRYGCFEDHGCSGAFFDVNPCGEFKNRIIEYVASVIN